jgi:hypothetical protein
LGAELKSLAHGPFLATENSGNWSGTDFAESEGQKTWKYVQGNPSGAVKN